jgi:hypothetical protein
VSSDAVWTSGRRRLPVDVIRGSTVEETPISIRLRWTGAQSQRFWFAIQKRRLANPEKFKEAVVRVCTSAIASLNSSDH